MPQGADRKQIKLTQPREITWYKTSQNNCFLAPENQTVRSQLGPGSADSSTNSLAEALGLVVPQVRIFGLRRRNDSPKIAQMGLKIRSDVDLLEAGGQDAPSGSASLLCPKPGIRSRRTAHLQRYPRPAKTGKSFRPRPLGFSRPHDWLRGPEAGPEKRTNVMASDSARRFLLSVPLEP